MNTNIEKVNDTRRKIAVTVDAAEIAKEKEGVVAEFVKFAKRKQGAGQPNKLILNSGFNLPVIQKNKKRNLRA